MRKHFLMFPLFLALILTPTFHASAAEPDGALVKIGNWIYDDTDASFSCDVKLSGAETKGHVFAVLYAESGKFKQVKKYAADETTRIYLPDTNTTDYIHVIWTDERYTPIAEPKILRMRDNGTAAFREFEANLKKLRNHNSPSDEDLTQSGGATRLLVSCVEPLNWEDYGVDYSVDDVIAGPDDFYIIQFQNPIDAELCLKKLQKLPSVQYAEFDSRIVAQVDEIDANTAKLSSGEDEERRYHSWGVEESNLGLYAEELRNAEELGKRNFNGEIIVAVVDTGVERDHSFLKDRLLPGYDFIEMDNIPQDEKKYGHGTHVAGIIADCTPDMNVKILPVRVLDKNGGGEHSSVVSGIYYAIAHEADIINLSLAFSSHEFLIDKAIAYAVSKNIAVVAAAGNDNTEALKYCPAHIQENCITVAAISKGEGNALRRWGRSNYGKAVNLSAPGEEIESSVAKNDEGIEFYCMSGTSQAAPHVSAAVALLRCEYGKSLTPNEISDALKSAARPLPEDAQDSAWKIYRRNRPDAVWTDFLGAGFLDMTAFRTPYAMLYSDGELTFQKGNVANPAKNLIESYSASTTENGVVAQYSAWYAHHDEIRTVSFLDAIAPVSMAVWFYGCGNLTEIRGLENLDTSRVTDMSQMFSGCVSLKTLDLSPLHTESVCNMRQMFFGCSALEKLDLTGWNTANVTDMTDMFNGCSALTALDVSGFNTSKVTDMSYMFDGCSALTALDVSSFDTSHVTDMRHMFCKCARLTTLDVSGFDTSGVTNMGNAFYQCAALTALDVSGFDTSKTADMSWMFYACSSLLSLDVSGFDTSQATTMRSMFNGCSALTALDVSGFDTSHVTDMRGMFSDCSALTALDVKFFNTSGVTNMSTMFNGCFSLTALDVSAFDTSHVTDMRHMFSECTALTALDVSGFDTSKTANMSWMFYACSSLLSLDVSGFNTFQATTMRSMFNGCSSLTTLDVGSFDTSHVTNMRGMFVDCAALTELDVSGFRTAGVTDMYGMFENCVALKTIYASDLFVTDGVLDSERMFSVCGVLVGASGTMYDPSHTNLEYARIDEGASCPGYFSRRDDGVLS